MACISDISNSDYSTTEQAFAKYLNYMKDHNFKVIALKDLDKVVVAD